MYSGSSRHRGITHGPTFYSRILLDKANHAYLGYELLLEPQQTGKYRATFGRLGVTPLDLAAGSCPHLPFDSTDPQSPIDLAWTMLPLAALPEPRVVEEGETISIVLLVEGATGAKLIDDIRINPPRPAATNNVPQIPTVSGMARDFLISDAELAIVQPRITLDCSVQSTMGARIAECAWRPGVALPSRTWPFHSVLASTPDARFQESGRDRWWRHRLSTVGGNSIKLECMNPIAPGDAAYNVYVLHDPNWEPTAENQKHLPALGTVSAAELVALRGQ